MVDSTKIHHKSEKTAFYTLSCSVVQVFNTGFLFVIASADVNGSFIQYILPSALNGAYQDLTTDWYPDVGANLIITYLFIVVWPLIDWSWFWFQTKLFVWWDQGCSCDKNKTKAKTIQEYIKIHGGAEFDIHNKYAMIVNLVIVAFLHGVHMPIFFPMCVLGLMVLYITDKLRMAYYYRRPVLYDARMDLWVNQVLLYAGPFLMLIFGYW